MIEEPLYLAALVAGVTALAFWLERRVDVLSRVGASLMVIVFGALLSNAGLVPAASPVYDVVTGPVTSLAIAWLLLAVHLSDLRQAGPRMLGAFALAALGTAAGAALGTLLFGAAFGDDGWRLAGAFTGTYTGGSLNFVAVGRGVELPDRLFSGAAAADNLTTALWLAVCLVLPRWIGRFYPSAPAGADGTADGADAPADASPEGAGATAGSGAPDGAHPQADGDGPLDGSGREAASGWGEHPFFSHAPVSVLSLARLLALGFGLLVGAELVSRVVPGLPEVLWLTILALAVGHLPGLGRPQGALQLGNYALHLFFAVIGIFSRVEEILTVGLTVFWFTLTVVGVHGVVVFVGGRLARLDVETLTVASQAAVGGPSTALAVAVSRGWRSLVLPGVAVGLLGYAAGNFLGFAMAGLFS